MVLNTFKCDCLTPMYFKELRYGNYTAAALQRVKICACDTAKVLDT